MVRLFTHLLAAAQFYLAGIVPVKSAGVGFSDKLIGWWKEGWRRSLCSVGDGDREERETRVGFLLQILG